MAEILDVDLLAFESGTRRQRSAVVDAVRRSLATGFVYTSHDLSATLLDDAYGMLEQFFSLPAEAKAQAIVPGSHGQAGYTGLLVETAAVSDTPDWKEMLNWGAELPPGHPLRKRFPHRYLGPHLPEEQVPGITKVLIEFYAGFWLDAVPPDDGVIINTGIMLEHLTNGTIPQGINRVVADPGQPGDRYSVVQFCHPTPWTVLAPVPSCTTPEHPQRFAAIEAGNLLDQVLYDINLVEDGRRVGGNGND